MSDTFIKIRVDDETKRITKELAAEVGLTLNDLVNDYLDRVISTKRIDLYKAQEMTKKTERLVEESERDVSEGRVIGSFDNAKDVIKALKSDGQN